MSKIQRLLIVVAVVAVSFAFLWPTVSWYWLTPKADMALALGSREQIREYARSMAITDLTALKAEAAFAGSPLLRQGRLSVVPLTPDQWRAVERLARGATRP